ncbi:hypothetical protein AaE_009386 [Aphanomyces astaci]|uniref:Uncharacterized protein n=1 Tax=Aphanomyces astaci TaxID=112090 RepID=A0A6A5A7Y4_APHAT|nr:hypothetical protein AaE_009386 [Aphanomyces astaci]
MYASLIAFHGPHYRIMSTLRARLAKAIAAAHAPPHNTILAIQKVAAECHSQHVQLTVQLRGKRVYLIDEESTPADWDDMQSLSEYDRKEFCLSVMVFSSQEAKISNWKRGDIVKLVVKDLKLYDGKQCQALFLDVQSHRTQITMTIEQSDGQERPDANTTTKQSNEQDCTDNSQDTASNSSQVNTTNDKDIEHGIQVKVEFPKVLGCEQGVKTPKKRLSSTDAKTYPATKKQTQAK